MKTPQFIHLRITQLHSAAPVGKSLRRHTPPSCLGSSRHSRASRGKSYQDSPRACSDQCEETQGQTGLLVKRSPSLVSVSPSQHQPDAGWTTSPCTSPAPRVSANSSTCRPGPCAPRRYPPHTPSDPTESPWPYRQESCPQPRVGSTRGRR